MVSPEFAPHAGGVGMSTWQRRRAGPLIALAVVLLALPGAILTGRLQLCDLQTQEWRTISDGSEVTMLPASSPDGEWIAIVRDFAKELWVVKADGSQQFRLSEGSCVGGEYPQ